MLHCSAANRQHSRFKQLRVFARCVRGRKRDPRVIQTLRVSWCDFARARPEKKPHLVRPCSSRSSDGNDQRGVSRESFLSPATFAIGRRLGRKLTRRAYARCGKQRHYRPILSSIRLQRLFRRRTRVGATGFPARLRPSGPVMVGTASEHRCLRLTPGLLLTLLLAVDCHALFRPGQCAASSPRGSRRSQGLFTRRTAARLR